MKSTVALLMSLLAAVAVGRAEPENLLAYNPGFEDMPKFSHQHGVSEDLLGWTSNNTAYDVNHVSKAQDAPEGDYVFTVKCSGVLQTAKSSMAAVIPGRSYELAFFSKKIRAKFPEFNRGVLFYIVFFDSSEKEISKVAGEESQRGDVTEWEQLTVKAAAPEGAAFAAARVVVKGNPYPDADIMDFRFDHFRLTEAASPPAQ